MKFKKEYLLAIFVLVGFVIYVINDVTFKSYNFIPILWIGINIYEIYKVKKYLKNKPENEIRIRNKNDNYNSILPFIMGFLICFFAILFYFIKESEKNGVFSFFILGLTSIFGGLNMLPSALIKVENGILYFENGKVKMNIVIKNIKSFVINEAEIRIVKKDSTSQFVLQYLEMNESEIELVEKFLNLHLEECEIALN